MWLWASEWMLTGETNLEEAGESGKWDLRLPLTCWVGPSLPVPTFLAVND